MDTVYTKPNVLGDVLLWDAGEGHNYCRGEGTLTIPASTTYEVGQVLEVGAATADYDIITTGTAIAVLLKRTTNEDTSAADVSTLMLIRGPAIVKKLGLSDYDSGTIGELLLKDILVRAGGNQG